MARTSPALARSFRDHIASEARNNWLADEIKRDGNFPYRPESFDSYVAYLEAQPAASGWRDDLDELWDGYAHAYIGREEIPLHDLACIIVRTYRTWCDVKVFRDGLYDYLTMGWTVPAEAADATKAVPPHVKEAITAFEPATMAMFTNIGFRGPWSHLNDDRWYNIHVPIRFRQAAIDAMTDAEVRQDSRSLMTLLAELSVEVDDETAIYKWTDADGVPIYYGITKDMHSRQTTHARYSAWGAFAYACLVERTKTRDDAMQLERELIKRDTPIFNRQYNDTPEAHVRLVEYLTRHERLDLLTRPASLDAQLNFTTERWHR